MTLCLSTTTMEQKGREGLEYHCRGGPCALLVHYSYSESQDALHLTLTSKPHLEYQARNLTFVAETLRSPPSLQREYISYPSVQHDFTDPNHERAPPLNRAQQYQATTTGTHILTLLAHPEHLLAVCYYFQIANILCL